MTEQVSVDKETYDLLKDLNLLCEYNGISLKGLKQEYERLKRLDENVKKWLSELKKIKTDLDEQQDDPDCPMSRKIASQIKKLESLYDER
jgi:hypothetical protein